ncbi:acyl carrier protein [Streptomyces sp. NPDC050164]|uniref:acyl carrier protein n=1 Tax=Streptomyces sp. NPDC050164 TaxID=3365605 RepID=UPI0037A87C23
MTITAFTVDDLKTALFSAAGADEDIDMEGDILDRSFSELGYDSLALLETAALISREHGISLEDDAVTAVTTPRELIALITSA